jgi:hypothetical protein
VRATTHISACHSRDLVFLIAIIVLRLSNKIHWTCLFANEEAEFKANVQYNEQKMMNDFKHAIKT